MDDKINSKYKKQKLKPLESIGIGTVTGFATVSVYLPLWAIKMRVQCDLPFTLNPRVLYRGYSIGLATMVPVTAFEIFNASQVESVISSENMVTARQRIFSSFVGGLTSSLITNPLNLIGTQQHKYGTTPLNTIKTLTSQFGIRGIYVGLPTIAIADGIFSCAFWGVFPLIKHYANNYSENQTLSSFTAGVGAGLPTAILTHPLDLIKTVQHQHADEKGKNGFIHCVKEIYSKYGSVGFFRGLVPRTIGMTATVLTAGITADGVESIYRKSIEK